MSEQSKILLVEDDLALQKLTSNALQKFGGFEVEVCGNGLDVMKTAERFKPDLILLDIQLPGMNGEEVYAQLQISEELQKIPVILTTGNALPDQRRRYFEAGMTDVIDKPYDPKYLSEYLKAKTSHQS